MTLNSILRSDCGEWHDGAFLLHMPEDVLGDEFLMRLSALNKGSRMERTAEGVLVIRPPVGGTMGIASAKLTGQLGEWHREHNIGVAFGCSIGYHLPNSAVRSPNASWVEQSHWNAVMDGLPDCFPPLCLDFVAELVPYDNEREEVQAKMNEYIANGARLGWLVDPRLKRVEVYRPNTDVQVLDNPATVSADPELPGFILELTDILT